MVSSETKWSGTLKVEKMSRILLAAVEGERVASWCVSSRVALYEALFPVSFVSNPDQNAIHLAESWEKGYLRFTFGSKVTTQPHGDCTSTQLSKATVDDYPGIANGGKTSCQGKRNSHAIGEANDGIRNHPSIES